MANPGGRWLLEMGSFGAGRNLHVYNNTDTQGGSGIPSRRRDLVTVRVPGVQRERGWIGPGWPTPGFLKGHDRWASARPPPKSRFAR